MKRDFTAALLACLLTLAAYLPGALEPLERPLIDLRMGLMERPVDPELVLVEVDPQSLHEIGTWPWPRTYHALLLDRLTAADAGDVFLDIDFSVRSDETGDAALEAALERRSGRTVLAAFRQWSDSEGGFIDTAPLPRFARHGRLASINMIPSEDGLIREGAASYPWRGGRLPSLAASITGLEDAAPRSFFIDYGIDYTTITRYSFVDVASGQVDPELLRGRPILVGATALELGDTLAVPRHLALPGPVVQALATQSLLLDRALLRLPAWIVCLAVGVFVCVHTGLLRNRSVQIQAATVTASNAALWLGAGAVQAAYPVIVDVVPFALGSLGAGIIAIALRFQEVARKLVNESIARQRSEKIMGAVAQNAFDALVTVDENGRVKFVNKAAGRMFGVSMADGDLSVTDFCVRPRNLTGPAVGEALRRVIAGRRHQRILCQRHNGEVFYADLAVSEVVDQQHPMFILLVRDIDRRVKAERRLLARERDLRRAKNEAEAANKTKTEFLANMSHELKTPLNAIIGFSEIMEQQLLGPIGTDAYLNYAKDIRLSGQHLFHAVSDVLEYSRIETGDVSLKEEEFGLVELCSGLAKHMKTRCLESGHAFEAVLPPAEACCRGDERLIKQAINQLLSNAIKFSPAGERITLALHVNDDGSAEIIVEDTGVGISEAEIETCFEAFGQANRGLERSHEGSGLGLTLAKRFVELHQGSIGLASKFGSGTKVTVSLPASRCATGDLRTTA